MKILFFCPDYYGIYSIIENGIREHLDCELTTVVFKDYKYKNGFQKVQNFFSKTFLKKNLKKIWASEQNVSTIKDESKYDIVFMICPDFLQNKELEYIKKKCTKSIVYYWDSFDNIPRYERTLPYFDVHFSFEKKDVKKYGLQFLTNFYYKTETAKKNEFDVFFIGALDDRIDVLLQITKVMGEQIRKKIIVQSRNKKKLEKYKHHQIELIENPITFSEAESFFEKSKVVIDIQKDIQKGLTFRVFEALGRRKKLITNNKDIASYDFYNPNNIFIWDENCDTLPKDFFDSPFEELDAKIKEHYSLKNWIHTVFNIR